MRRVELEITRIPEDLYTTYHKAYHSKKRSRINIDVQIKTKCHPKGGGSTLVVPPPEANEEHSYKVIRTRRCSAPAYAAKAIRALRLPSIVRVTRKTTLSIGSSACSALAASYARYKYPFSTKLNWSLTLPRKASNGLIRSSYMFLYLFISSGLV